MKQRKIWKVFLLLAIALAGCGPSDPLPPQNTVANLQNVAGKLEANPNATPEAKALAGNALKRVQTDQQTMDFQSGK